MAISRSMTRVSSSRAGSDSTMNTSNAVAQCVEGGELCADD
jgi:hypothetical protein